MKRLGTIKRTPGWFTASFKNKAGIISKDFRSKNEAENFLKKHTAK